MISFTVPYPVDSGCRVRIDFPSDMPLTPVLTSVSGTTLFFGDQLTKYPDYTNNYVEIDGCTDSWESGFSTQLFLTNLANSPSVKATSTFQFTLYDMVGTVYYKIGRVTTGITIP
jgi:hypothetical protein